MKRINRIVTLLLSLVLLLTSVCLPTHSAPENLPTMFVNDEPWYNESAYPKYDIYSEIYLPLTMITALEGITSSLRETQNLRNLVISSTSGKYLTFDLDKSIMYTAEGEQKEVSTYLLYRDVRYVPAKLVCEYFGLTYQATEHDEAVRIADGRAALTFDQVLGRYHPALMEQETTTLIPAEPTLPEGTPRSIYFIIHRPWEDEDAFEELCLLLAEYSAAAIFVCREIDAHTELVRTLYAYGHRAALWAEGEEILSALQDENEALCRLTKRKTRLVMAAKNIETKLEGTGYVQCLPIALTDNILTLNDPHARVVKELSRSRQVYLSLTCSQESVNLIEKVLKTVAEDDSCSVGVITDSEWMA